LTVADRRSYCRICAAACGIVVTVDGEQVVRVRGDAEHPVSRGYTCAKGRGLPAWHHSPDRIDQPRVDGRNAPWAEVLDDLGTRLRTVVDESGADAVATYLATGLAYDAAGQVATGGFMRALGSSSFYSAATVDNAPVLVAADLVAGNPMLNPVWDPTAPGLLLLVATNPVVSHGYGTALPDPVRHLRDYRGRGGEIWVIDPRRTETAALADTHLSVRPGSDVALLAAVVAALLVDDPPADEPLWEDDLARLRVGFAEWTPARAAAAAGIEVDAVARLVATVLAHRGRVAAMCGTGTTMAVDGILVEWLRWLVLVLSGSLDRPGGMHFHRGLVQPLRPPRASGAPGPPGPRSRPELGRMAGQLPAVALADEIEAGHVRALLVTGGNPIVAFPEPDRLRAALARLDVLAVVDVAEHELTELATHVLPATGQLERADVSIAELTAVRSGLQATDAVVSPGTDRKPAWWILGSLAPRLGLDLLGGEAPDDLTDERFLHGLLARSPVDAGELFARGPHGIDVPVEHGWVRATMLPDGHWRIAPPELLTRLAEHRDPGEGLVLVPRRETAWNNSVQSAGPGTEPVVRVHPDDAAAAGVTDATRVTVRSAHGTVTASLRADANVRPGVVAMTHGHAASSPGRLTSAHADVDPLTTMPRASGLPVTLEPAD
jgi:anaerobic selenocysteine-containing dehydrogenase